MLRYIHGSARSASSAHCPSAAIRSALTTPQRSPAETTEATKNSPANWSRWRYDAYGKATLISQTGTDSPDPQRANTKDTENDATSPIAGLINDGFRYRDPVLGVFLSRDPAGFVDGPNLYVYVRQNPWSKFDPEGLSETWPWGSWVDYTGVGTVVHLLFDVGSVPTEAIVGLNDSMNRAVERLDSGNSAINLEDLISNEQERYGETKRALPDAVKLATSIPNTSFTGPVASPRTSASPVTFSGTRMPLPVSPSGISARATTLKAQQQTLLSAMDRQVATVLASQSNNSRGPVLSGVMDTVSGEMFFAQNAIDQSIPSNLHPLLKARLEALGKGAGGETGPPGYHSEVYALNEALLTREAKTGKTVTESQLSEFLLHNRSLRGKTKGTGRPPRCDNCKPLTEGVKTVDIDE